MTIQSNDLANSTADIVGGFLRNPRADVGGTAEELKKFMTDIHEHLRGLAARDVNEGYSVHGPMAQAITAAPAPQPLQQLPAPSSNEYGMTAEARESLKDSTVYGGGLPAQGSHLDERTWPNATPEQRQKFRSIIEKFNIQRGVDGIPVPRVKPENFISHDKLQVVDPIDGKKYKMLRRHLEVAYKLDYSELLAMFRLTPDQLPHAGPAYSDQKSAQAFAAGLGKHKTVRVEEKQTRAKVRA